MGCSMVADNVATSLGHLHARDTTLAYVSRAPQAEIRGLKERMGWEHIPWYTVTDDFDTDHDVREWHGHNAFIRDGEKIFRTYLINGRGDEGLGTNWSYLDITALGRQEAWEDSPDGYPQTPPYEWWNYHDAYGEPHDRPRRRRAVRGAPAARVDERREHRAARGTRVGCSTEGQRVGVAPHTPALAPPGRWAPCRRPSLPLLVAVPSPPCSLPPPPPRCRRLLRTADPADRPQDLPLGRRPERSPALGLPRAGRDPEGREMGDEGPQGQTPDLHPAELGRRDRRRARRARQPPAALHGLPRRGPPALHRRQGRRRARRGAAPARSVPARGPQEGAPQRTRDRGRAGLRHRRRPPRRHHRQRDRRVQGRGGDRRHDREGLPRGLPASLQVPGPLVAGRPPRPDARPRRAQLPPQQRHAGWRLRRRRRRRRLRHGRGQRVRLQQPLTSPRTDRPTAATRRASTTSSVECSATGRATPTPTASTCTEGWADEDFAGGPAGTYFDVSFNTVLGEQNYGFWGLKTRAAFGLRGLPATGRPLHGQRARPRRLRRGREAEGGRRQPAGRGPAQHLQPPLGRQPLRRRLLDRAGDR